MKQLRNSGTSEGLAELAPPKQESLTTELLILPDGQILVHNLTQPFAELLAELNPDCEQITSRLGPRAPHPVPHDPSSHELSD